MPDPRLEAYAALLVERSVNVQPGWQVMVQSSPLARPLIEEVIKCIGRRGAYVLPRVTFGNWGAIWAREAPTELLHEMAPIDAHAHEHVDAYVMISAPENSRDGSDVPTERQTMLRKASQPALKRLLSLEVPWVGCQYPTASLAQDAGMTQRAFEDFLYAACLLDWDEEGRKMHRIADRFDRADLVRLVGEGTDLTFSLRGRPGQVDDGHLNMPGGEVFYSPVEDSAEGTIMFSEFPASYGGFEVQQVRMVYRGGRVVEASSGGDEHALLKALDTDPGARVLGEFGIGCNPGIQRHMKNTLYDEKMYGTVHLAVGAGFPFIGGSNTSSIHWDMVKDLRRGGRIYCDGELVQENGEWVF